MTAFDDLTNKHAAFVTGHVLKETVEYKAHGKALWVTLNAIARPAVNELGGIMANMIDIWVSRETVVEASFGHDLFRIPSEKKPGEWWPVYRLLPQTDQPLPDPKQSLKRLRAAS